MHTGIPPLARGGHRGRRASLAAAPGLPLVEENGNA